MRKSIVLIAVLGAAFVLGAALQPASASCNAARTFSGPNSALVTVRIPNVCEEATCAVSHSPAFKGNFWALGGGNPAATLGADSQNWPALTVTNGIDDGWLARYPGYNLYLGVNIYQGGTPNWTDPRIDGCIDAISGNCMTMLMTDQDALGNGYFIVMSDAPNANLNYEYDHVVLAPIPKARITGSTRVGPGAVNIRVGPPLAADLAAGIRSTGCGANPITGFKIYQQAVPRNGQPPSDRNVGAGWIPVGTTNPITVPEVTVPATCAGDQDIYLAQTLVFDSGYELALVSHNSTRVQCGPNLAEPTDRPRVKPNAVGTPRPDGRSR